MALTDDELYNMNFYDILKVLRRYESSIKEAYDVIATIDESDDWNTIEEKRDTALEYLEEKE